MKTKTNALRLNAHEKQWVKRQGGSTPSPSIGDAFTVKNWLFGKAPKKLTLKGDKTVAVESATHIIEFPGGAVEVARCSDGSYWVHAIVNRKGVIDDAQGLVSARGKVIDARVDREHPRGVSEVADAEFIEQFAVRIAVEKE